MNSKVTKSVSAAVLFATASLFLLYQMMPASHDFSGIPLLKGRWQSGSPGEQSKSIEILTGFTIYRQLQKGAPCCTGRYILTYQPDQVNYRAGEQGIAALYIPAVGGDIGIRVNGRAIDLPDRDYSSVGPVIPLFQSDMEVSTGTIEIDVSGAATPFHGLWKAPPVLGNYFDLIHSQKEEAQYQVSTAFVTGWVLLLFSAIFFGLHRISGYRFPYYRNISLAFLLSAVFEFYLAGVIRELDLYFGAMTHYAFRSLTSLSFYLIIISFIEMSSRQSPASSRRCVLFYAAGSVAAAAIATVAYLAGAWEVPSMVAALVVFCSFWPLVTWKAREIKLLSLEWWMFTVTLVAFFGTSADAAKTALRLVQVQVPYSYFSRYTSAALLIFTILAVIRHFLTTLSLLELEKIEKAKASAVAKTVRMLAHDVRSPFSTLKSAITVLRNCPPEDRRRVENLLETELNKKLASVNAMISDVMEFGGHIRLNRQPVDLNEVVTECFNEIRETYAGSRIQMNLHLPDRTSFFGDGTKIRRAVFNIVKNAVEATPTNGGVSVSLIEEVPGSIIIKVHNTGSYIAPEKLASIFNDFFTEGKGQGTGLGLAIAKQFVEAHSGNISCTSERNSGTCFSIHLPAYRANGI